jgi:RNA recognition motif-containing protein
MRKRMNIYVGNLSYQMTNEELQGLFEQFGEVSRVNIIKDRETGRSKGFGFVEMVEEVAGKKAIEALDGEESNGRNLRVNEARPREDRPKRSW